MKRPALVTGVMLLAMSAAGAFGAVTVYGQIKGLKAELASARRELAGAKDRLARLERRLDTAAPQSAQPQGNLGRPDGAGSVRIDAPAPGLLELSREEVQLVRDYIKLPPAPPGAVQTMALGAPVPDTMLMPLPSQITDKFPRLLGARFATDRNGAIVIVRRGSRSADAVISRQ
jgi:hypothetical protein